MTAEPVHRTILVLDIVEFAHPQRTDPARLLLREKLYELIHQTLTAAGEDPGHVPCVDLGDGVMVLLDPQLAAARVVEVVIDRLRPSLAALNRRAPGHERLRLRVALHRGEVLIDPHGFVGGALIEASRLSNAAALREQLDATAADLGLIVSDQVWKQLTGSRNDLPEPGVYQPISLSTHDVTTRAWMHVPGHPNGPVTMPSLRLAAAPVYRSIFAVDIQRSTAATRTDLVKERLRSELYRLLDQALAGVDIGERHHDPTSGRGDGFLLLLHPVDEVPKTLLLGGLVPGLAARLAYRQLFRVRVAGRSHQGWVRGP